MNLVRRTNNRQKFKKFKDFLNTNSNWICRGECDRERDLVCHHCRFVDILNYSFNANPRSTLATFAVFDCFDKLFFDYYKKHDGEEGQNCF